MTNPEPSPPPPDPTVAWNKVQGYLDKLFDALDDLEEGGGVVEAARLGGWKGNKLEKARASLKATRDAIDGALALAKPRDGKAKVGRPRRPTAPPAPRASGPPPAPGPSPPPPPTPAVAPCNTAAGGVGAPGGPLRRRMGPARPKA